VYNVTVLILSPGESWCCFWNWPQQPSTKSWQYVRSES